MLASQNRWLFISDEVGNEPTVEEFSLESIYLAQHRDGVRSSSINISICGGDKVKFTDVEKDPARPFAWELKARGDYSVGEIHRLAEGDQRDLVEAWYGRGTISNEELADWKRRLFGPLPKRGRPAAGSVRRPS